MSEPSLERLSRFTPDTGGLDRDALLFAAGRSSVRPARGWIALASVLTGTQALSLRPPLAPPDPARRPIDRSRRQRPRLPQPSNLPPPRRRRTRASGRPATACGSREPKTPLPARFP